MIARHPQEVEGRGHSFAIVKLAKDAQRLLMAGQGGRRIADVHLPVADAVQAVRDAALVIRLPRELERRAEIASRPVVVLGEPEHPEGDQRFPLLTRGCPRPAPTPSAVSRSASALLNSPNNS